ncbi:hypothetical protein MKX03_009951 [Papaver bracteatum]|nr:hypothetical protein MKX03_009951 [Papaver bracteatum]
MKKIHALVLPFSSQGHVIPLMNLSNYLSKNGFKIMFVNTKSNHETVVASLTKQSNNKDNGIRRIPEADERYFEHLFDSISTSMSNYLEITCVIADENMGWVVKVSKKMNIPVAAFWTASVWLRTIHYFYEKFYMEFLKNFETFAVVPMKQQIINFYLDIPAMDTDLFPWTRTGDCVLQQSFFRSIRSNTQDIKYVDLFLCNSVYELEKPNFPFNQKLHYVASVNFLPEDSTCLIWIDQQPARSVIYIAFTY